MAINLNLEKTYTRELIEMYSSAFTLSDMEIFVFPQLLYSLVLANIMSPVIWEWRKDRWFRNIEKKSYYQRVNRVKQFIMDNFVFNLDLETWGLTTKERELARFRNFMDEKTISKSNALFGYEGDKYYFNIDIRKHFGLDKYTTNIIPYWKTETVEAMQAFRYKEGFNTGAGECVSLSTLYAAALFVVARIPLEKIYLMTTPLHSQNFIDVKDGILTNNRRIVTKNMWFNGTSLSSKARRALENEEVTIVSHLSGYIHTIYKEATIDPFFYKTFKQSLLRFLTADINPWIISNFLRRHNEYQKCFQYCQEINGRNMYIEVETIYRYEHNSPNNFSTDSRTALLKEIDVEEFSFTPIPGRILLNDLENILKEYSSLSIEKLVDLAVEKLNIQKCIETEELFRKFKDFLVVKPRLPSDNKEFVTSERLNISQDITREELLEYIREEALQNQTALLTLYAFRDMDYIDWEPFIKAAVERNPVSLEGIGEKSMEETIKLIQSLENQSIYDGNRLAQPDEVWNYKRGDGIEKAILLFNVIKNRFPEKNIIINIDNGNVNVYSEELTCSFRTNKNIKKEIKI